MAIIDTETNNEFQIPDVYQQWGVDGVRQEVTRLWEEVYRNAEASAGFLPGYSSTIIDRVMNVEFLRTSAVLSAMEGRVADAYFLDDLAGYFSRFEDVE